MSIALLTVALAYLVLRRFIPDLVRAPFDPAL